MKRGERGHRTTRQSGELLTEITWTGSIRAHAKQGVDTPMGAEYSASGSTMLAVLGLFSLRWIPYGDGRKKWIALGLAGLWTWPAWVIGEAAKVSTRFSFLSALIYFLIVSLVLWGVFVVVDWLRHQVARNS